MLLVEDDLKIEEARRVQSEGRVEVDLAAVSGAHVAENPGQLSRAVRNLLDNAARHATSRITLILGESAGATVLTIAADGPESHQKATCESSSVSAGSTKPAALMLVEAVLGSPSPATSSSTTAARSTCS